MSFIMPCSAKLPVRPLKNRLEMSRLVFILLPLVLVACTASPPRGVLQSVVSAYLDHSYGRIGRTVSDVRIEKTAATGWDSFGEPNLWCVRASYTVSGSRGWSDFRVIGRSTGPFYVTGEGC